jgi:hypothetical protein
MGGFNRVGGSHGFNKWFEVDRGGSVRSRISGPAVSSTDRPTYIFSKKKNQLALSHVYCKKNTLMCHFHHFSSHLYLSHVCHLVAILVLISVLKVEFLLETIISPFSLPRPRHQFTLFRKKEIHITSHLLHSFLFLMFIFNLDLLNTTHNFSHSVSFFLSNTQSIF